MISFRSLGKVSVATPGTVVQLFDLVNGHLFVSGFRAEAVPGATDYVYLGVPGLNKTTKAGVIATFAAPVADATPDSFVFSDVAKSGNMIDLAQLVVDADVAGEGLVISYWVA